MRRAASIAALLFASGCGGSSATPGHLYRVPSSGMEPTLHCARPTPGCEADSADMVVVQPYAAAAPQRGDIVVFHTPRLAFRTCGSGGLFIKRLIGLPGERWEERRGAVYIDGRKLAEPYITTERRDAQTLRLKDIPPCGKLTRIPNRAYLVLGDNRAASCDSRVWGLVPRANIVGRVVEIGRGSKRIHLR